MEKPIPLNFKPPAVVYTKSTRTKTSKNCWKNYYMIFLGNYWKENVESYVFSILEDL